MGQFYSQLQANCRGSRKPTRQDPSLNECLISLVNTEYLRNDEAAAEKATALKKAQFMDSLMAISESSQFQSLISFSIESDDYHGVGKTDDVFVVVDCSERQNRIILGNLENGEMNVYEGYDWITGTAESTGVSNVNGKKWEGELRENQPFGYGVLYNENDKREYEGFLYDQMKMGYGIEYNSDTETVLYNGCFYNNQRHGPGVLFNREGETEYEGLWKEGKVDSPPGDGKDITSLVSNVDIPNNSFLHVETSGFLFWLHSLRSLVIGSECFVQARTFTLDGLSQLEQIVVGEKSFSCGMTERTDGVCRITKCPALKSILFQDCSFADYSSLELESLPSLQSLHLGSCCFLWSPSLVLTNLPALESVTLDNGAFPCCHSVIMENLPLLQTITLGDWALNGDSRDKRKTYSRRPFNYKNSLLMRNLPSLTCIQGKAFNFCYMGLLSFQSGDSGGC